MPELPEVEFARRALVRWMKGHKILSAEADKKARTFRGASPEDFEALRGKLERADRRGKYLLLGFSDGRGLVAHFGMTGKLVKRPKGVPVPFSRARLVLDSGDVIHFRDPRLLGRIELRPSDALGSTKAVEALGTDPLVDGLTPASLQAAVKTTKQDLKIALMDQAKIAGLGNIHAAEALFRAGLHPARKPASLSQKEWAHLCQAIHDTITFGLEQAGDADDIEYVEEPGSENPFLVYMAAQERRACAAAPPSRLSLSRGERPTIARRASAEQPSRRSARRPAAAKPSLSARSRRR